MNHYSQEIFYLGHLKMGYNYVGCVYRNHFKLFTFTATTRSGVREQIENFINADNTIDHRQDDATEQSQFYTERGGF